MDTTEFRLALKFRQLAESSFENQNLDHAYFYFLNCLRLFPSWKAELQEKFFIVINCLGQLLEYKEQYIEIFEVYKEAVDVYTDSAELFCNLGAHLLRLKYSDQAIVYLKKALEKNPAYFPAYQNLHSAYCALVERWHYRMLNDSVRNNAFKNVIFKKIAEGHDSVLDIGTGTGLFCLYAHWAGAKSIYACDYNHTMLSIAAQVFHRHQMDKVKLISKISNSIRIPNDIPERVSLVVTETMDSCMLGEHILNTLNYAWKYLLKPPYLINGDDRRAGFNGYGAVIPSGGTLWFRLIQSHTIAKNYMFPLFDSSADDCASALSNISFHNVNETKKFRKLDLFRVTLKTSLVEPYDTERLQNVHDVKYLSESNILLSINFNDPSQIEKYVTGKNSVLVDVECACDGFLHAVCSWFTTYLDKMATLSSAPDDANAKNCCWDQAVFPTTKPYQVFSGSKVSILSEWSGGKITLEVKKIVHPNGFVTIPEALSIPVSVDCVKLLNDFELLQCLQNAARDYFQVNRIETLRIMDLFPVPLFGLTVLSNLLLNGVSRDNVELVCVVKSPSEEETIKIIAQTNMIPVPCLSFVRIDEFDEAITTRRWQQYFDVILLNLLDSEGVLNEEAICHLNSLKLLLKPEGILLPKQIMIHSQLVHSDYIEESMRIVDPEINGYGIGQFMNEFQVPQLYDVNVNTLKYKEFSNPFLCYTFTPENLDTKLQEMHAVRAIQNGTVNSILCWFSVNFFAETYHFNSNQFSSVHQTAFLSNEPIIILQNEFISVDFVYHHGAFFMNLRKCDTNV